MAKNNEVLIELPSDEIELLESLGLIKKVDV